ncbi:hypothetical protein Q8A73_019491 [Channa argus]|nr:hypothetical protein Q8A73_019491 [Channa argus]
MRLELYSSQAFVLGKKMWATSKDYKVCLAAAAYAHKCAQLSASTALILPVRPPDNMMDTQKEGKVVLHTKWQGAVWAPSTHSASLNLSRSLKPDTFCLQDIVHVQKTEKEVLSSTDAK